MTDSRSLSLTVRHTIDAAPARVFAAWVEPRHVLKWWGPKGVACPVAEVDLRVGGRFRLANDPPTGERIWISGEFERISPPRELVYTWSIEPSTRTPERVTVRFEPKDDQTEVIVIHERITDEPARVSHEAGWVGCLDGLVALLGDQPV